MKGDFASSLAKNRVVEIVETRKNCRRVHEVEASNGHTNTNAPTGRVHIRMAYTLPADVFYIM